MLTILKPVRCLSCSDRIRCTTRVKKTSQKETFLFFNYCLSAADAIRFLPISGQVEGAAATETVDMDSLPDRFKGKIIKVCIHSFPA